MVKCSYFSLLKLELVHVGQFGFPFIKPAILFLLNTACQLICLESKASIIAERLFRNFDDLWFGSKLYGKAIRIEVNDIALWCGRDRALADRAPRNDFTLSCSYVLSWLCRHGRSLNALYHSVS